MKKARNASKLKRRVILPLSIFAAVCLSGFAGFLIPGYYFNWLGEIDHEGLNKL